MWFVVGVGCCCWLLVVVSCLALFVVVRWLLVVGCLLLFVVRSLVFRCWLMVVRFVLVVD